MSGRLRELEAGQSRRWGLGMVLVFLAGFLGLLGLDWTMRFVRYDWQNRLWTPPTASAVSAVSAEPAAERPAYVTNRVAASAGGDLTALLGVRRAMEPYLELRPAGIQILDREGYPNRPRDPATPADVVVVGDSFMGVGLVDQLFASQLADQTGLTVYNMGVMGHGPFLSLERFLRDPRFVQQPPRYLIWGFAEREIGGEYFARFRGRLAGLQDEAVAAEPTVAAAPATRSSGRVHWDALSPRRLQVSLPDTSFVAQAGQWLWTRLRYLLFRQVHPWVVPAAGEIGGGPMLFFAYHIETLKWTEAERDVPTVAAVIEDVAAICAARGIELIVVLIPEKEEVYRDWIPKAHHPAAGWPPSPLAPLTEKLTQAGIKMINLLPVFQQATQSGQIVYWRDDTHWNPEGAGLAAAQVAGWVKGEE